MFIVLETECFNVDDIKICEKCDTGSRIILNKQDKWGEDITIVTKLSLEALTIKINSVFIDLYNKTKNER